MGNRSFDRRAKKAVFALLATVGSALLLLVGPAQVAAQEPTASISGVVQDDGDAAPGISVDLFESDRSGNRLRWLDSTRTDADGYRFDVDAGCYVVTFIADPSRRFENNTLWTNVAVCVADGEQRSDISATLRSLELASIFGAVSAAENGRPLPNVQIDLFEANGDGSRGRYLETARTRAGSGAFGFEVAAGCYVLTYVGEPDQTFVDSGSRWLERLACVDPGEVSNLDRSALQLQPGGRILARVERFDRPVEDIQIDVFSDDGRGGREEFLGSFRTAENGFIDVTVNAGCYILTFIAPNAERWESNDAAWLNQGVCIEPGDQKTLFGTLLADVDQRITLEIAVTQGGAFVPDVAVDIYAADADGNRGEYQDSGVTRAGRSTILYFEPGFGCWVMTFVAPDGLVFDETGTRWVDRPFCATPDQTSYSFAASLVPLPGPVEAVDVRNGPQAVTGRALTGETVDFVIAATPGREVGIEFVTMTSADCDRSNPLFLQAIYDGVEQRSFRVGCRSFGPFMTGADGSLTIRLTGDDVGFDAVIVQSDEETVYPEVDVSAGTGEITGEVTLPFGSSKHVIVGQPGDFISVHLAGPVCDVGQGFGLSVSSPAEDYRPAPTSARFDCRRQGVWQFPSDGRLDVRMSHFAGPTSNGVVDRSYSIAIDAFQIEERALPIDQERVEVSESITGFAGPDYIIDSRAVDALRFTLVDRNDEGVCDANNPLWMILFAEGMSPGYRTIGCDDRSISLAGFDTDTLTARIYTNPGSSEPVGSFRLIIDQLMYETIAVDLTAGPVEVNGSILLPYDQIEFVVDAEPEQLVSLVDLDRWSSDATCDNGDELTLASGSPSVTVGDDGLLFGSLGGCARASLARVPDSGTLRFRVSAWPVDAVGDYSYTLTAMDDRELAVDLTDGPVEVTETLTLPMEGTWYRITGTPGRKVEGTFTSLTPTADPDADCLSDRFGLVISFRNRFESRIFTDTRGCRTYDMGEIGEDGTLLTRIRSGGDSEDYQGSYTMTIAEVVP